MSSAVTTGPGRPAGGSTFDDPEAYLAGDRRRAIAAGRDLPELVTGAALFADVSGFTPLTEALASELGPQRGAEELTAHLNRIFHALIEEVHRAGGEVIYFSGDAITCWLDGDDGVRAAACALALQRAMAVEGNVRTPAAGTMSLSVKVAVATGTAHRFVVGDPDVQLIEVLAGAIVDDIAATEHLATAGDVLVHESTAAIIDDRAEWGERREGDGVVARVLRGLHTDVPRVPEAAPIRRLTQEEVRPWLLPTVHERLTTGRGEFVGELRAAYPVFIRFRGFDHDRDPKASAHLDELVQAAQHVATRHGGNVLQLTLGDKGAYLYAVFGSPVSHEDDGARAVAASLALRDELAHVAPDLQIGIAHGRLRSGTYGHDTRRTFVCLGDAVNLAARLMAGAPPGAVHVTERVRRAAGDRFEWTSLGPRPFKGKSEPIEVFAAVGSARREVDTDRVRRYPLPIVGRDAELAELAAAARDLRAGHGQVVHVVAEAGRGKSRLVAEAVRAMRADGLRVVWGEAPSVPSPYEAWREPWTSLLGLPASTAPSPAEVHSAVEALGGDPRRAPLLGPVLGIHLPDSPLTATFDAKLRATSLVDLLTELLGAAAATRPTAVVVEDAHWLDPLSAELLGTVAGAVAAGLPVVLLVTSRPGTEVPLGPAATTMVLDDLGAADAGAVVAAKAAQLFGRPPSDAAAALVTSRAGGNPFYVEELLHFLHERGVDLDDTAALAEVDLPDSLQALVLGRIDALAERPRRVLKVASVVGRSFTVDELHGSYPDLGTPPAIGTDLDTLGRVELVVAETADGDTWLFHHDIVKDVAYESLPFAMRADLHERVAEHLELAAPDLDRLAHHYWRSHNTDKQRTYLALAGEASQAAYANATAIVHYERLATLEEGAARAGVLRRLAKVVELTGDWPRAADLGAEALELARAAGDIEGIAHAELLLAELARKQGRYPEAAELLDRAADGCRQVGDTAGLGQVMHVAGTLAAQQGDHAQAEARYGESLVIRRALGDRAGEAALLSNLGVVAEYRGDLHASRLHHEQALAVRKDLADPWAIAVSLTNLGMLAVLERRFTDARDLFEEALRLDTEVGDPWMVAIGHHNLGNAYRGLDDHRRADQEYRTAMRAFLAHDDRWAIAFLLEDRAALAAAGGLHHDAVRLAGAADTLRAELGAARAPGAQIELDGHLTAALDALGDEADTVRELGRSAGIEAARTLV